MDVKRSVLVLQDWYFSEIYVTLGIHKSGNKNRKWTEGVPERGNMMEDMEDGKVLLKKVIIEEPKDPVAEENAGNPAETASTGLSEEIKMTVTTLLHKDGEAFARVSFLRENDWAEGVVPGGKIEQSEGFNGEEIEKLEAYLTEEEEMILSQAKKINPIKNLFDM